MKSNILVTGSNGQLGTELKKLIPDAVFADVDVLDITDELAVSNFVRENITFHQGYLSIYWPYDLFRM